MFFHKNTPKKLNTELDEGSNVELENKLIGGSTEVDSILLINDFNEFFKKFTKDSIFQIKRIQFPLEYSSAEIDSDELIKEQIQMEEWIHLDFYYDSTFRTRETDQYMRRFDFKKDSVTIEYRGIDNGIWIDYLFVKQEDNWILINYSDYSN